MRKAAALLVVLLIASALATADDLSGTFKGTWTGGQASGDITVTFRPADGGGTPKADVSFTIAGQDVKCNVTSVKVDGSKVELVYEFELGDTKLQSTVSGQVNGKAMEGSYKTKSLADGSAVDEGTWKATAS
jgi:hypothetical protein